MAINLRMEPRGDYLEVCVTGHYETKDALDEFQRVLDACKLSSLSKVLIDFRGMPESSMATDRILYAFGVEGRYLRHLESGGGALRIAYVGSSLSTYQPGRDLAVRTGLPFQLFDELQAALDWLSVA